MVFSSVARSDMATVTFGEGARQSGKRNRHHPRKRMIQ